MLSDFKLHLCYAVYRGTHIVRLQFRLVLKGCLDSEISLDLSAPWDFSVLTADIVQICAGRYGANQMYCSCSQSRP